MVTNNGLRAIFSTQFRCLVIACVSPTTEIPLTDKVFLTYKISHAGLLPKVQPQIVVQPMSNDVKFEAKMNKVQGVKDDLECEFCQALVKHARDILTTNTTREEFQQVLEALCKQSGSFAKQVASDFVLL